MSHNRQLDIGYHDNRKETSSVMIASLVKLGVVQARNNFANSIVLMSIN